MIRAWTIDFKALRIFADTEQSRSAPIVLTKQNDHLRIAIGGEFSTEFVHWLRPHMAIRLGLALLTWGLCQVMDQEPVRRGDRARSKAAQTAYFEILANLSDAISKASRMSKRARPTPPRVEQSAPPAVPATPRAAGTPS